MVIVRMNKRSGCEVIDNNFKNGMDCCPFIGRCSAYAKEMRKQSPFNAHPIDYIPDGCRIIGELPDKHGRLIDADVLSQNTTMIERNIERNGLISKQYDTVVFVEEIENAPTVLEAST